MKVYQLMTPEELDGAWKARRQRDLLDIGDTLQKIKKHFCFEVPGGGSGLRGGQQRGTGVMREGRLPGEGNAPEIEREASHVDISDLRSTAPSLRPDDAAPEVG